MIFGEELACFFPIRYMLECHLFLQSCFSAGCTRSLDSFRLIDDPDSFLYSFWSACTLGYAARSSFFRQHFFIICREKICVLSYSLSLYSFLMWLRYGQVSPEGDISSNLQLCFWQSFFFLFEEKLEIKTGTCTCWSIHVFSRSLHPALSDIIRYEIGESI